MGSLFLLRSPWKVCCFSHTTVSTSREVTLPKSNALKSKSPLCSSLGFRYYQSKRQLVSVLLSLMQVSGDQSGKPEIQPARPNCTKLTYR